METIERIEPRIPNIAGTVPDALKAMHTLHKAAMALGVPETTHMLIHLRVSQINGCSVCCQMHDKELRDAGQPDEKIATLAAWREAPYFSASERAALALAEAGTRLADRPDPVPDEVWDEAARLYDDDQLASLVLSIASINVWNRLNAITRQPAGAWA
ncbi:MAG TPA: carboxymuconolactone decarboxylase family protein [Gaiellaceae bacterium]|jgi:AhpD family alkylhydroperoxidase|nr:carboxymuconolactone decarboxylase family protein [Gaiellaceae bacterium]